MLVPQASSFELLLVLFLVESLEGVNEESIVLFENGVFARELQWEASVKGVAEACAAESLNRSISVEHAHVDTGLNVSNVLLDGGTSVLRGEGDVDTAGLCDNVILAAVLIAKSMSANNNRLSPSWNTSRDVLHHDWLSEDGTVKDVTDGTVRAPPHLLEVELLNSALIGSDGCAFDSDFVFFGGVCGIDGDLVIGGVARGYGKVVVLGGAVHVGVDVTLLDPLPDHAGHLVTIDIDDRVGDLNFFERSTEVSLSVKFVGLLEQMLCAEHVLSS